MDRDSLVTFLKSNAASAFDEIVKSIREENCNLFLGAAVHAAPPADSTYTYPENVRPLIGNGLAEMLAKETTYASRYPEEPIHNLQRVAQDYEVEKGRQPLIDAIRRNVEDGRRPSPLVYALAELGFRVIVTTNYDTLFEQALSKWEKLPFISSYISNLVGKDVPERTRDLPHTKRPSAKEPLLFKIHGDIRSPSALVITEEDYIQFVLRMRDLQPYQLVPNTVLEALRTSSTLFVGYSLRDYNLRLLLKTLRTIVDPNDFPITYSVDRAPDPLIWHFYSQQSRYVNFVAWDVWKFVPDLYRAIFNKEMPA